MRNIWNLFTSDIRHLFANVTSVIITFGLVLLPSVFTWYNVMACWNVFDNTGNLMVAVASVDEGYQSELVPLKVNIGDQVISSLRANDDIDWVFTDQEDAIDGAASGKYYAAVVIPRSFSRDMMTFYSDDVEHANIVYYSNEKKSAIAPKITDRGADTVSYQVNKVFAETVSETTVALAQSLSNYADQANADGYVAALSEDVRRLSDRMAQSAQVLNLFMAVASSSQQVISDSASLIRSVNAQAGELSEQTSRDIDDALGRMTKTEAAFEEAYQKVGQDYDIPTEAKKAIDDFVLDYQSEVKPSLDKLETELRSVSGKMGSASEKLASASAGVDESLEKVSAGLGSSTGKLRTVSEQLSSVASRLGSVADSIDKALEAKDSSLVKDVLSADAQSVGAALSAPVKIERNPVFAVENFGSAMTPLYATLALFIGALVTMVVVKPIVSQRALNDLGKDANARNYQLFLGRYGVMSLISFAQSSVLALGNMLFLQVQVAHPLMFLLCYWIAGQVFMFMVYTLVVSFANLGKAAAVILLIVQVTGCNGSFPLQLLPGFVQSVSPWLPATHVVNAMRAAMMGVYCGDFWIELGELCLFVVPFLILGLVLSKPLSKFMGWYIKRVEESKLMS